MLIFNTCSFKVLTPLRETHQGRGKTYNNTTNYSSLSAHARGNCVEISSKLDALLSTNYLFENLIAFSAHN